LPSRNRRGHHLARRRDRAGILALIWRPLFAATVNRELAEAENMNPDRANIIFMLLMAAVIAISMKIVGVLADHRHADHSRSRRTPVCLGPRTDGNTRCGDRRGIGFGGLFGSLEWDTPAGPSIVVAALGLFVLSILPWPAIALASPTVTSTRANSLRKEPAMNDHVHAPVDLTKNQSLVMGR
jgi:hypothetical protein